MQIPLSSWSHILTFELHYLSATVSLRAEHHADSQPNIVARAPVSGSVENDLNAAVSLLRKVK